MKFHEKYVSKSALIGLVRFIFLVCPIYLVTRIIRIIRGEKYNGIWLICERKHEARDNGYHLFKYIRTNHPSVKIYYLITKDSKDFPKIAALGSYIYFGSLKHYFYYFLAEKHISSHGRGKGCMPDIHAFTLFEKIFKFRVKKVDIKHGITKDFQVALTKEKSGIDLFVCGSFPEYQFVLDNFGYEPHEVKYLGLARFDNLHTYTTKNQIMYMPTWRTWLGNQDEEKFRSSTYYKQLKKLISNTKLHSLLEMTNMDLVFCLHPLMQNYARLFDVNHERIIVATNEQFDIQDLLKESKILITDYSSVFFDFAYMKKPVVYYHFDYDEYRAKHFQEGYFDYERDGFGKVCRTEDEVISEIEKIIGDGYDVSKKYLERIDSCFVLRDNKNCQRIFEEISRL